MIPSSISFKTTPVHNTLELRKLWEAAGNDVEYFPYRKLALKWLAPRRDPETKKLIPLTEEEKSYFKVEADVASKLNSEYIPKTFGGIIETEKGIGYLASHIDGRTLEEVLDETETFWRSKGEKYVPPEVTLSVIHQVASALQQFQERGIAYNDIQPGNIMIGLDGTTFVIDPGQAEEATKTGTKLKKVGGVPDFFAPEILEALKENDNKLQRVGEGPLYHPKSNSFSMGVLMHWMMKNDHPYTTTEGLETLTRTAHKSSNYQNPLKVNNQYTSEEKKLLLDHTLVYKPENRFSLQQIAEQSLRLLHKRTKTGDYKYKSPKEVLKEFMSPIYKEREMNFKTAAPSSDGSPIKRKRRRSDSD